MTPWKQYDKTWWVAYCVGLVIGSAYAAQGVLNITVFFLVAVVCLVVIKRLFQVCSQVE